MAAQITHLDRRPRDARDYLERALAAVRQARRAGLEEAAALQRIAEAYLQEAEGRRGDVEAT